MDNRKHKREISKAVTEEEIDNTLLILKNSIKALLPKQQRILMEWLKVWSKYLIFEEKFNPNKLVYYKRGDIVLAHFGYNVGSEIGGTHYAIVIEDNNNKANSSVVVIPISSLEEGKTQDDLHPSEVYLGKIVPNSESEGYAKPLQMRAISKLRIIKPKSKEHKKFKVDREYLVSLDEKIGSLFTKQINKKK